MFKTMCFFLAGISAAGFVYYTIMGEPLWMFVALVGALSWTANAAMADN